MYGSDNVTFTVDPDKAFTNCVAPRTEVSAFAVNASGDQFIDKVTPAICLSGNHIIS
jgi:hypothetical protein